MTSRDERLPEEQTNYGGRFWNGGPGDGIHPSPSLLSQVKVDIKEASSLEIIYRMFIVKGKWELPRL